MEPIELKKWEDFEDVISKTFEDWKNRKKVPGSTLLSPIFRGHENESWKLKTTLERIIPGEFPMEDYFNVIREVKPAVESFAEKSWTLDKYNKRSEKIPGPPSGCEFMTYLRHHGFPSPLLDWSLSPYIAAFFAYRSIGHNDENAAIYSYIELFGGNTWSQNKAAICGIGDRIATHKRHIAQQCQYTICKKGIADHFVYCDHEDAVKIGRGVRGVLTKYTLPRFERSKVLDRLNKMNINAYSLFGNEESLMETLAYKELERKNLPLPNNSTKPTAS